MIPGGLADFELKKAGFLPGFPGDVRGPFDRPEKFQPHDKQPKDIWEDVDGIRTVYRPNTLLMSEPLLWGPVVDWMFGHREISEKDLRKKSNFWVEAIAQMSSAHQRTLFPEKDEANGIQAKS